MELRQKIIESAERVIRDKGLAHTTTKEIARIAGCSEGSLYNHFESKGDLFLDVLKGQLPQFMATLITLSNRQGKGTVQENLTEVMSAALAYFHHTLPMLSSVFSEPGLLARHQEGFWKRNEGPHRANEAVADYIAAEQKLGRIRAETDPLSTADLLLGACFQHAFHMQFSGKNESKEQQQQYVKKILRSFLSGWRSDDNRS